MEVIKLITRLSRWQGDRGTYHLVSIKGDHAEAIAMHARIEKLELGTRRGFGSVKVMARIGDTQWSSSVFPQDKSTEWILLVSKKVMKAENIVKDDQVMVELELL
ncbi:DUF1905 domain-containing protein [Pontixanthobacter aestiaquae]|uniref:DUF1905 domain-containing protein n=1 Tax=Pontixanthobacter aestiaquae TaxID=1509367 RepID=A0A844Z6L7_9SPHN|nr:DUF1905 domain-containing protein [Pontixanthobacter aestiaquae]MDN3646292.1 DUF1905 domain-containing protein [Pontixanthobacter aestiaquae]MXO82717.1 DUF1905 domain-containing protein [Pontixanthobacter aestiaquae]